MYNVMYVSYVSNVKKRLSVKYGKKSSIILLVKKIHDTAAAAAADDDDCSDELGFLNLSLFRSIGDVCKAWWDRRTSSNR